MCSPGTRELREDSPPLMGVAVRLDREEPQEGPGPRTGEDAHPLWTGPGFEPSPRL